jgi:hypothetical protein
VQSPRQSRVLYRSATSYSLISDLGMQADYFLAAMPSGAPWTRDVTQAPGMHWWLMPWGLPRAGLRGLGAVEAATELACTHQQLAPSGLVCPTDPACGLW